MVFLIGEDGLITYTSPLFDSSELELAVLVRDHAHTHARWHTHTGTHTVSLSRARAHIDHPHARRVRGWLASWIGTLWASASVVVVVVALLFVCVVRALDSTQPVDVRSSPSCVSQSALVAGATSAHKATHSRRQSHALTYILTHILTHTRTHHYSLNHSLTSSLTRARTHSLTRNTRTHALTRARSLVRELTHARARERVCAHIHRTFLARNDARNTNECTGARTRRLPRVQVPGLLLRASCRAGYVAVTASVRPSVGDWLVG